MYVLMFSAGIRLRFRHNPVSGYRIPGGKWGTFFVGAVGIIGSLLTFVIGFFAPDGISVVNKAHYGLMVFAGILIMGLPGLPFMFGRYRQ